MFFKLKQTNKQKKNKGSGQNVGNWGGRYKSCESRSGNEAEMTGEKLTLLEGSHRQQTNVGLLQWKKKGKIGLKI